MRTDIQRRFVDTAEGQIHYREAGSGGTPLVMLHPSPGSAKMLEPLVAALAAKRRVVAADTLGNGDSAPPRRPNPDLAYFVGGHLQALDALGLERFDLYGSHTGANIAIELAIAYPTRVRRLILDGVSLYTPEERAEMLERYALPVKLDHQGSQIHFLWNFVRDAYLFWPWYKPDAPHARRVGLPSADELHDKAVEVFKAARTYHLSYRAAIAYGKEVRLPLVKVPTLLACARTDMLLQYFERVKELLPSARTVLTESPADAAARFDAFLG
ncbi:MAG TPA: alpha/beta hydrolase [Burkholderiales bacterium]|nr:alpha/beta hydrolase [Burkholderiales bacterium]